MQRAAITYFELITTTPQDTDLISQFVDSNLDCFGNYVFCSKLQKLLKDHKAKQRYIYMLVLTYDLSKGTPTDEELEHQVVKICDCKTSKFIYYEYSKEHHKDGRTHFHVMCETTIPLDINKNKGYQNYLNNYGIILKSRTGSQNLEKGLIYINKESPSIRLL